MITELYIASGCIGSNPSMIGGTYAYRVICDDDLVIGEAAVLPMSQIGAPVTNNQAEMLALLAGLERLPALFNGAIYSQSKVTLGRAFWGWRWSHIPLWMHKRYQQQRARLGLWHEIRSIVVDGKSEHTKWCERACREAGERFLESIGKNIPSTLELAQI